MSADLQTIDPRVRLSSALRVLMVRLLECEPRADLIQDITEAVERTRRRLAAHPRRLRFVGPVSPDAQREVWGFDYGMKNYSPVSGSANPLSPPLRLRLEDDRVTGAVNFPSSFAWRDGATQRGCVAAAFDEILGATLSGTGRPAMTGILEVRYLHPVPTGETVYLKGRVRKVRGPLVFTEGTLRARERIAASAEGIFFRIDEGVYQRLAEDRNRKIHSPDRPALPPQTRAPHRGPKRSGLVPRPEEEEER
jgi:acyl-coenzyme A thioesterase PaaI-like protein